MKKFTNTDNEWHLFDFFVCPSTKKWLYSVQKNLLHDERQFELSI